MFSSPISLGFAVLFCQILYYSVLFLNGFELMGRLIKVAGTNQEGRINIVKRYCKVGLDIDLVRESDNVHDANAIAVYLIVPRLFGLTKSKEKIGYVSAGIAKSLARKIDNGTMVQGYVRSFYVSNDLEFCRVSAVLEY
tara:strand:- start:23751 stop:24167 length:417 start_codon:yes stop_codon:yes gene_type:complete